MAWSFSSIVSVMSTSSCGLLPLDQVDLAHLVRLVLGQQLGERQVVARERVDAIEHDAAGDPVVPVPAVEVAVRAIRVLRDDQVGPPPADLAGRRPAGAGACPPPRRPRSRGTRRARRRAPARRSAARLRGSAPGAPARSSRSVDPLLPLVTIDVRDLAPLLHELRDGPARPELGVVGMRRHHHDSVARPRHALPPVVAGAGVSLPWRPHRHAAASSSAAPRRNGADRSTASAQAPITSGPRI